MMLERLSKPSNLLALAAAGYGLYSAGRCVWNVKSAQGCPKCETTGAVLGLGLAGLAAYVLLK